MGTLLQQLNSAVIGMKAAIEIVNEWTQLCPRKTLFTKQVVGLIWPVSESQFANP